MSRFERGKSTALVVVPKENKVNANDVGRQVSRYNMPLEVMDTVGLAGDVAARRMVDMLTDERKFNTMKDTDKLRLLDMAMNRAYGAVTNASTEQKVAAELGHGSGGEKALSLRDQLQRITERRAVPEVSEKSGEVVQMKPDTDA